MRVRTKNNEKKKWKRRGNGRERKIFIPHVVCLVGKNARK